MKLVSQVYSSSSEAFLGVLCRLWGVYPVKPTTNKKLAVWGQARIQNTLWMFKCVTLAQHLGVACTWLGFWKASRKCVAPRLHPWEAVMQRCTSLPSDSATVPWDFKVRSRPWKMDNSTMFWNSGIEGVFKLTVLRRSSSDWRWRKPNAEVGFATCLRDLSPHLNRCHRFGITRICPQLWIWAFFFLFTWENTGTGRSWELAVPQRLALGQICQLNRDNDLHFLLGSSSSSSREKQSQEGQ